MNLQAIAAHRRNDLVGLRVLLSGVAGYMLLVAALSFFERAMLYNAGRDADQSGTGRLAAGRGGHARDERW